MHWGTDLPQTNQCPRQFWILHAGGCNLQQCCQDRSWELIQALGTVGAVSRQVAKAMAEE